MGRRTALTQELQDEICEILTWGADVQTACARAGIGRSTYAEWIKRGKEGEQPFQDFLEATDVAQATCEVDVTKNIIRASRNRWQAGAWWIKWKHARGVQRVELTGKDGMPIAGQLTPEGADLIRQRILYGDKPPKQLAAGGAPVGELSRYEQPDHEVRVDDDEDEP